VSAVVTAWTESEIIWVFLCADSCDAAPRTADDSATPRSRASAVAPGIAASLGARRRWGYSGRS